ncbi:hypothetical protein VCHA53O466_50549 [Vibrio chagasii]|nr:hypothetical protein VCHA53O466_50549 [Vibrio chagasii]
MEIKPNRSTWVLLILLFAVPVITFALGGDLGQLEKFETVNNPNLLGVSSDDLVASNYTLN